MKLNEKSLGKFALSGAPADKEGYLNKRGELNKGFQKRWFVLKGNLFFYYEKRGEKEPVGMIILEQCRIELSEHSDGFVFQIVFPGSASRIYILGAETQEEMESWMKVLSCASYDYMRMMVKDLQSQLKELSTESKAKLVEEAKKESLLLRNSYFQNEMSDQDSQRSSSTIVPHSRSNPFNTGASESALLELDAEGKSSDILIDFSNTTMRNHIKKKSKSFREIHEEYGREIKKLSDQWLLNSNTY